MWGCVLLTVSTLLLSAVLLRNAQVNHSGVQNSLQSGVSGSLRPSVMLLSIEPSFEVPEQTVVLPGYLLPDDGVEEPFHAGG